MYEEGEAQDVGYESAREEMSDDQYQRKSLFLSGDPVTLKFIGDDTEVQGRYSAPVREGESGMFLFVRERDTSDGTYGLYYVNEFDYGPSMVRIVMLPGNIVMGQVVPREID